MKVKELIKLLEVKDQELDILVSKDPEGNGYVGLDEVGENLYVEKDEVLNEWVEDVYGHAEVRSMLYDYKEVVVLWP